MVAQFHVLRDIDLEVAHATIVICGPRARKVDAAPLHQPPEEHQQGRSSSTASNCPTT